MEIRKITEKTEMVQALEIESMAFHFDISDELIASLPRNGEIYWGAFENGKVISCIVVIEYQMMYHGNYIPMFGIAGVTTRVEYRRRGYIKMLFEAAFTEMKEKGYVYSYLYPFSFAYYNKFGYTHGINALEYTAPVASFRDYTCDYDVSLYEKGDSHEPYAEIYDAFSKKYTGIIKKDDWKFLEEFDPLKNHQFMYLFSKNGKPKAFFGYGLDKSSNPYSVDTKRLAWVDSESLRNVLGFIGGLEVHFSNVKLKLPTNFPSDRLVSEDKDIKRNISVSGQSRIINVEKALLGYPWPKNCDNQLSLKITDNQFDDNNGVFTVTYGKNGISVKKTNEQPDIEMHIRVLNTLLLGTISFSQLDYIKDKEYIVHSNQEELEKVFILRDTMIVDHF